MRSLAPSPLILQVPRCVKFNQFKLTAVVVHSKLVMVLEIEGESSAARQIRNFMRKVRAQLNFLFNMNII